MNEPFVHKGHATHEETWPFFCNGLKANGTVHMKSKAIVYNH